MTLNMMFGSLLLLCSFSGGFATYHSWKYMAWPFALWMTACTLFILVITTFFFTNAFL